METETRHWSHASELLHKDHYTPEELAELLDLPLHIIRHAAWSGELRAFVCDHHVLSIRRGDVLEWLKQRG